jgi:outer membrane protein assembly factor BamE (lipoprotein component of BamABCDE complex)
MHEWNVESQNALNANLKSCIDHGMKKSELIMQVGQPTAKEVVEDGEIWIYELVDRGNTTTTGHVGPFGSFSATSSTPVERSTVKVRFNNEGVMVAAATSGPARGQFRFLRSR